MKYALVSLVLLLAGCAAPLPKVVQVPVPVVEPCPKPVVPPKPDLSALAALKPDAPPQTVINVMLGALKKLAQDDAQLRILLTP